MAQKKRVHTLVYYYSIDFVNIYSPSAAPSLRKFGQTAKQAGRTAGGESRCIFSPSAIDDFYLGVLIKNGLGKCGHSYKAETGINIQNPCKDPVTRENCY